MGLVALLVTLLLIGFVGPRLLRALLGPAAGEGHVLRDPERKVVLEDGLDQRLGGALQGINETLPILGGQPAWDLGPEPPPAVTDEPGEHTLALSEEELAALKPPAPVA